VRKRTIGADSVDGPAADVDWLDLEQIAQVELTSEDPDHPIEAALGSRSGPGWRAADPGPQVIRLIFDRPQHLRRIHLVFQEDVQRRTQEFVLGWSSDGGKSYREVLRQQYTFSPPNTTREVEDYQVNLADVTVLALEIIPGMGDASARASLASLRLA
jgi:hypothetical protein